jgi:hypothetical protein
MSGFDHGILNVPLSKRGGGSIDAQIDRYLAAERREARKQARAAAQERKAAKVAREAAGSKFTAATLVDAVAVRDRFGWHEVVRVNKVTVTVRTAWSWNESIHFGAILEVRQATK